MVCVSGRISSFLFVITSGLTVLSKLKQEMLSLERNLYNFHANEYKFNYTTCDVKDKWVRGEGRF